MQINWFCLKLKTERSEGSIGVGGTRSQSDRVQKHQLSIRLQFHIMEIIRRNSLMKLFDEIIW